MHIVKSKDTGEETALKKTGGKTHQEKKKHLPRGPTSYMQEMITISGGQGSVSLPESWVTIRVEEKPVGFMVDTGAQYSVLNQKDGPMSKKVAGCREQPGLNDMDGLQNSM